MKKKILGIILVTVVLLAILFVPIPSGTLKDGGTRVYSALTYKIVDWNRMYEDETFDETKIYFGADQRKTVDELFAQEEETIDKFVCGEIIEMHGTSVLIRPLEGEWERRSADRISFNIQGFEEIGAKVGSVVEVTYRGGVMESYPAQIRATRWRMA
ncbi:MAG: hypothetical protein J6Q82_07445 [Clostridia bacterium]|nr:hypothetical protein [Clostridia bacterium]